MPDSCLSDLRLLDRVITENLKKSLERERQVTEILRATGKLLDDNILNVPYVRYNFN